MDKGLYKLVRRRQRLVDRLQKTKQYVEKQRFACNMFTWSGKQVPKLYAYNLREAEIRVIQLEKRIDWYALKIMEWMD